MSGEPNFSVNFISRMLGSETCSIGDVLVYDSVNRGWLVATSANRTATSSGGQAIAITAWGSSIVGQVSYQASGPIAQEVTGLAVLTPSTTRKLVRTSSAGRIERVDSYTAGDDIVGYAYWDGRVALHLGLPWASIATFAGVPPSLPANSVQYYLDPTTLGGAARVKVNANGDLELRAAGGSAATPTTGRINLPYESTTVIAQLDATAVARSALSFVAGNGWFFGTTDNTQTTNVRGGGLVLNGVGTTLVATAFLTVNVGAAGSTVPRLTMDSAEIKAGLPRHGLATAWGASEGETTIASAAPYTLLNTEYNYASLVFSHASSGTYTLPAPTAAQTYVRELEETGGTSKTITIGSGTSYTLAASTRVHVKVTNNGVFEVGAAASSSETTVNVTSTTPGDIAITSATRVINCNASGGMTITGFTAPTSPAAGLIAVTNNSSSDVVVNANAGGTAINGVKVSGSGDPTFYTKVEIIQYATVFFAYDFNAARWFPAIGGILSGS